MAVFLVPKSHLMSKVGNFRPLPGRWRPRWRSYQTASKQQQQQQQQSGGFEIPGGGTGGGGRTGSEKGKLKLKAIWSWQAGAGWTIFSVLDWWLLAAGGWLTWRGVFLRWTPLGMCVAAAIQWHLHNRNLDRNGLPRTAAPWQMQVYCSLPLRLMSRGWGWLADCRVPIPIRPTVYGLYSTAFGVNIEEAASSDFKNYRSLAEFFTRSLRDDVRIIDYKSCLVSPCDGKVLHFGPATKNSYVEQVKGVSYSLESFLGPPDWSSQKYNSYIEKIRQKHNEDSQLYQCIIYLAPGDYHRFHSPASWQPELRRHFSGELLSVSPKIATWVPGLFCLNERALYIGQWQHGFFSFTAVGATNVGSVQMYIDEELKTNRWLGFKVGKHHNNNHNHYDELKLRNDIKLEKGELLGQFNMGSTIVLIFEAPKDFKFNLTPGQTVRMGQKIGCVGTDDADSDSDSSSASFSDDPNVKSL